MSVDLGTLDTTLVTHDLTADVLYSAACTRLAGNQDPAGVHDTAAGRGLMLVSQLGAVLTDLDSLAVEVLFS